jgi:tRNA (cmo5U34)-methyltransferase
MDAAYCLQLVSEAAVRTTPHAQQVVDIGCGAGNYTLAFLQRLGVSGRCGVDVTLIDLSRPMLDRAVERVSALTTGRVTAVQGDLRDLALGHNAADVILAAAVLHHLRTAAEWTAAFQKFFAALRPGGSLWIFDLVTHESPAVQTVLWQRYGEYLTALRDGNYRDQVFAYIEQEDTPAPLTFQLDLLRRAGFSQIDVLHKTACFAAFGAVK